MKLSKFKRLIAGETLALIAPSLPLLEGQPAAYEGGKSTLIDWGFRLHEGATIGPQHWWSAGRPEAIAAEIHAMFLDPEIKGIVALNGGFSATGMLDRLDYQLIRNHPKPFIGMSDITAYQWGMLTQAVMIGLHGNTLAEGFGEFYQAAPESVQMRVKQVYLDLLTSPEPLGLLPAIGERACWRAGTAEGRLIGGNLRRFAGLMGTPYFPDRSLWEGGILLIEDIGETIYDISLNLHRLRHAGLLEQISGLIVGRFTWINQFFEELEHPSLEDAILEICRPYDFPILYAEGFGHRCVMLPYPFGCMGRLNADQLEIELVESIVQ